MRDLKGNSVISNYRFSTPVIDMIILVTVRYALVNLEYERRKSSTPASY
jgi:hypothetical protein